MQPIVVFHSEVGPDAPQDELDGLVQAEAVAKALAGLGEKAVRVPFTLDMAAARNTLLALEPTLVFNLVESVLGQDRLGYLAPALLDALHLPYTGSSTESLFITTNKLLAKRILAAEGLATPKAFSGPGAGRGGGSFAGRFIVKSVWEHASIGLDQESVVTVTSGDELAEELARRRTRFNGPCFAEEFIEGREFNISIMASESGPVVLPPAEIRFDAFPAGTARIVDYSAKWLEDSFAFHHTPRSFSFPPEDGPLLAELAALTRACWDIFSLAGYARVDFRVDEGGRPWILEVNANPCLAPDSGFVAAAAEAGIEYEALAAAIVSDARRSSL